MIRCTRCVLPETFPGIRFDDEGVCQYCRRAPSPERLEAQKAGLRSRFEDLVRRIRPLPGYHCLIGWSGGKDSTYTLWLLKEVYGLRVLAFTFDNGFTSPTALRNIRVVAEQLGVDHVLIKPRFDLLREIFVVSLEPGMYPPRALERASAVCNSCMAIAKGLGLRIALTEGIQAVIYGWSPGQIPLASALLRTQRRMLKAFVQTARAPLEERVGPEAAAFFPSEHLLETAEAFPYLVSPLAFLEYDEDTVVEKIRRVGWERPKDTDPTSTNCLLNSFACSFHQERMGYHPYVAELASLVRAGHISREEALARLAGSASPAVEAAVAVKLGLRGNYVGGGDVR